MDVTIESHDEQHLQSRLLLGKKYCWEGGVLEVIICALITDFDCVTPKVMSTLDSLSKILNLQLKEKM